MTVLREGFAPVIDAVNARRDRQNEKKPLRLRTIQRSAMAADAQDRLFQPEKRYRLWDKKWGTETLTLSTY